MKFEEQFKKDFPSMEKKAHFVNEFKIGETPEEEVISDRGVEKIKLKQEPHTFEGRTLYLVGDSCRVYNEEDIQKYCLDKEKTREVIDKHIIFWQGQKKNKEIKLVVAEEIENIKKELGLE